MTYCTQTVHTSCQYIVVRVVEGAYLSHQAASAIAPYRPM